VYETSVFCFVCVIQPKDLSVFVVGENNIFFSQIKGKNTPIQNIFKTDFNLKQNSPRGYCDFALNMKMSKRDQTEGIPLSQRPS